LSQAEELYESRWDEPRVRSLIPRWNLPNPERITICTYYFGRITH
jgi:hypothetical protein